MAIAAIETLRPDAVVLDLSVADGVGVQVLEAVQRLRPKPIIVVLANYPVETHRSQFLALGADHFLDKSSDFGRLPQILLDAGSGTATEQDA